MSKTKLKVGDVLYEKNTDGRGVYLGVKEHTVTKVGNKYFYTDNWHNYGFTLDELLYVDKNYPQYSRKLYRSIEEINQEILHNDLKSKLRVKFPECLPKLTLDQLTRISEILNETP